MLTRREFVRATGFLIASGAALSPARALPRRADDLFFEWKEVAKGLLAAVDRTGDNLSVVGGNAVLLPGKGGALLVDTKQSFLGNTLLREALLKTDKIAQCVNTHHHFDHAGGNHALTRAKVPITSHAKAWERLKGSMETQVMDLEARIKALEGCGVPGAAQAAADARAFQQSLASVTPTAWEPIGKISTDGRMDVAGRKVDLRWFGGGHTDNDLVVHFPDLNAVATGDLVFHGLHPYYDASADANTQRWERSLVRSAELCNGTTVVVPGHGPVGGVALIRAQIEYFKRMRDFVAAAMKESRPREEVVKLEPPEPYRGLGLRVAFPYLLGGLFDELSPPRPKEEPGPPPAPKGGSR
jgi:cyclase